MLNHDPIRYLIEQLSKLPGVGERTAMRLVLHMLSQNRDAMRTLSHAINDVATHARECDQCHNITTSPTLCQICQSVSRNSSIVCVVSTVHDLMAFEATSEFRGLYHVLHGTLAPMDRVGPDDLRISTLIDRVQTGNIKEVIIATPPTVEGEATALYLAQQLSMLSVQTTRIASGVPVGGDLQFADRLTLSRSLHLRRGMEF